MKKNQNQRNWIKVILLAAMLAGCQENTSMKYTDVTLLEIKDKPVAQIQPGIFGQFLERPSWGGEFGPEAVCDDEGRLPDDVMTMLKTLHPPVVRFPGGTDVDKMNWTDLISNAPDRRTPERPVSAGKGGVVTNRFGLDEFFALGDEQGFEKILVGNLRQALYKERPLEEAALHEAGLLAYANSKVDADLPTGMAPWGALRAKNGRAEPVGVRYFMVGNETYFFWPPKKAEDRERLGVVTDEEAWAWFRECLLAYGQALKAIDPKIELIIDGFHDAHNPANDTPNTFRKKLFLDPEIRALYRHLGAHHYAPMGFHGTRLKGESIKAAELTDDQLWLGLASSPGLYNDQGQNIAFGDVYRDLVDAGYKVAVTEWNFNAWNKNRVLEGRSFKIQVPARLATAGFLHGMLRHADSISLATQSMLLGTSWDITAIRAHTAGEKPPYWLPQGQVALFYRHLTGKEVVESRLLRGPMFAHPAQLTPWWTAIEELALLDTLVTRDERGIFVHAINRSLTEDLPLVIELPSRKTGTTWEHHILNSDPSEPFVQSQELPVEIRKGQVQGHYIEVIVPKHSVSVLKVVP